MTTAGCRSVARLFRVAVAAAALAMTGAAAAQTGPAAASRDVMLVPMPAEPGWPDLAFLAALPAACTSDQAAPVVLAVAADAPLPPETLDFLRRYRPSRLCWIGAGQNAAGQEHCAELRLPAASADAAACAIAGAFFVRSLRVVVAADDDYPNALAAAVLAARQRVPLLFADADGLSVGAREQLARLGASSLQLVGEFGGRRIAPDGVQIERLPHATAVARWLQQHDHPVEYLAAAVPADRHSGHVRKLSLAAAVLAAGRRGAFVPLGTAESPPADPTAVAAALTTFRRELGSTPEYLCLTGLPDTLPMAVVAGGEGIDKDPPSDLPLGNVDADPFVEVAYARFVAEDGPAGALLAARSLAYAELVEPSFAGKVAIAEWERLAALPFAAVGFAAPVLHDGKQPFGADSPLASVAAILHGAHSSWLQLGHTYTHDSRVLLAPCLVESSGCSPAALDQDPEHRSVALRLLRNGAIGFVGNVRRGIAQQELYRTEFWNAALAGQPLGRAHRHALNRMLVSVLANGEAERGGRRYQLHNAACYGDPALAMHLPAPRRGTPASSALAGRTATVRAPSAWWRGEAAIVEDWKYTASPTIYGWRGAGVGVESRWDPDHRRNADELVFTAEVRTRRTVRGLAATKPPAAPLGWDGKWFVDEHADGSRSVYFRVRMVDTDMATGAVLRQVDELRFRLD
jgi:hypothetical protein